MDYIVFILEQKEDYLNPPFKGDLLSCVSHGMVNITMIFGGISSYLEL